MPTAQQRTLGTTMDIQVAQLLQFRQLLQPALARMFCTIFLATALELRQFKVSHMLSGTTLLRLLRQADSACSKKSIEFKKQNADTNCSQRSMPHSKQIIKNTASRVFYVRKDF